MSRLLSLLWVLVVGWSAASSAAALEVEMGGKLELDVVVENRTHLEASDIRVEATASAAWLEVQGPSDALRVEPGASGTQRFVLRATDALWGDEARVAFEVTLRFAGEAGGGRRRFVVPHTLRAVPRRSGGVGGETGEREAVGAEVAWHLVEASVDTPENAVQLTVHNAGRHPIRGFALEVVSDSWDLVPTQPMVVTSVEGETDIAAGGASTYEIPFVVRPEAAPGATAVLAVLGRASTLFAEAQYETALLVAVDAKGQGAGGNFEGFACYNLPPSVTDGSEAEDLPLSVEEHAAHWLPVPKGTELVVSQVYDLIGPRGLRKPVEQFVGYGHVLDERGYFRMQVDPIGRRPYRFRLVAETIAREITPQVDPKNPAIVQRYRVGRARAAVTPLQRRTYRVISQLFYVEKAADMLRPEPQQEFKFVVGDRILLPYHGYRQVFVPDVDAGILIDWEGELSTGGQINHFDSGSTYYDAYQDWSTGYAEDLMATQQTPGLLWHNRTELLHVLSHLIRGQDYVRSVYREIEKRDLEEEEAERRAKEKEAPKAEPAKIPLWLKILRKRQKMQEEPSGPDVPPVIAVWRMGRAPSGGAETGYWLQDDGVWRLEVSGAKEDPDEADPCLVLRGYGAAVRRYLLEDGAPEAEPLPSYERVYDYGERTTVERAFALGFDTYFACAAMGRGRLENHLVDATGRPWRGWQQEPAADEATRRRRRTLDLDRALSLLGGAYDAGGADELLRDRFAKTRGLDSPLAVAAGLWRAHVLSGGGTLVEMLRARRDAEEEKPSGLEVFLDAVARFAPAAFPDLAVLGLAPSVVQEPGAAVASEKMPPSAVQLLVDARGMLADGQLEAFLEVRGRATKRVSLFGAKGGEGAKGLQRWISPGQFVPPEKGGRSGAGGGAAKAKSTKAKDGDVLTWQLFVRLSDGTLLAGPSNRFTAKVASLPASSNGAPPKLRGADGVEVGSFSASGSGSEGATGGGGATQGGSADESEWISYTVEPYEGMLEGRAVLGDRVVRIEDRTYAAGAELTLDYDPRALPSGAPPPTIHRYDEASGAWENLGGEERTPGSITVEVDHTSVFALLVDPHPPACDEPADGPDPFDPQGPESWTLRTTLSAESEVRCDLVDGEGRLVRRLCDGEQRAAGRLELTWDGRDADGELLPDGVYGYVLTARDRGGREGEPTAGQVRVYRGFTSAVAGRVRLDGRTKAGPVSVASVEGSSVTVASEDLAFFLGGLAPGRPGIRVSAPGHFPETRTFEVEGARIATLEDEVVLTDRALGELRVEPALFQPADAFEDGEALGLPSEAVVRLAWERACEAWVEVLDAEGRTIARLFEGRVEPGVHVLAWPGVDDRGRERAGWHTVRVGAVAGGVDVVQEEATLLVDRGLVDYARAIPRLFSPNDDGFDEETGITFRMTAPGVVDATVRDAAGKTVRTLLEGSALGDGWHTLSWNGCDQGGALLGEGAYSVRIVARYETGEASRPATCSAQLDLAPPRFLAIEPENGVTLEEARPRIRARLERAADLNEHSLRVKIDGLTVKPDTFDAATGWLEYTPKTSLGSGVHIALVYARDVAGNAAMPEATSFEIEVPAGDRTKPTSAFVLPVVDKPAYTPRPGIEATLSDEQSGIDPDSIRLKIDGVAVPNRVRRFIPGRSGKAWDVWQYEVAVVLFDPLEGRLRYNPMSALEPGRHVVHLDVTDAAGNRALTAETTFDILLDETPPTVTIQSPSRGATLFDPVFLVEAEVEDEGGSEIALGSLTVTLDGRPIVPSHASENGHTVVQVQAEAGLEHVLTLRVRDGAGNVGHASLPFRVRLDEAPPVIALGGVLADGGEGGGRREEESGGDIVVTAPLDLWGRIEDDVSGVEAAGLRLTLDGEALPLSADAAAQGRFYVRVEALEAGRHVLVVSAKDRKGHETRVERGLLVLVTADPPVLEVTSPAQEVAAGEPLVLEAKISSPASRVRAADIEVHLDGRRLPLPPSAYDEETGRLRFFLPDPSAEGRQHLLRIEAKNEAGARTTKHREFLTP